MEKSLSGVKALVTGAGRGIGRAIALRLSAGGAKVAVADVLSEQVEETAKLIIDAGGESKALVASVTVQEDVDRMIKEAVDFLGGLDVLVNNAGVSGAAFIEAVTDQEIERILGVNLIGTLRVTRAAAPHLKKSGRGRIVNLSSVEGIRGSGLVPVYASSKAGILGLTRANAIEMARYGCTVNAVCPGPIQTDMMAPLLADEKYKQKAVKGIPMRRLGVPEDIAGAVAFFASDEASFITGNALVIDGGMTTKAL